MRAGRRVWGAGVAMAAFGVPGAAQIQQAAEFVRAYHLRVDTAGATAPSRPAHSTCRSYWQRTFSRPRDTFGSYKVPVAAWLSDYTSMCSIRGGQPYR